MKINVRVRADDVDIADATINENGLDELFKTIRRKFG